MSQESNWSSSFAFFPGGRDVSFSSFGGADFLGLKYFVRVFCLGFVGVQDLCINGGKTKNDGSEPQIITEYEYCMYYFPIHLVNTYTPLPRQRANNGGHYLPYTA